MSEIDAELGVSPFTLLTRDERPQAKAKPAYEWSDEEIEGLLESAEHLARQPEARRNYAPIIRAPIF